MNVEKLKQKILDLAIRGKLVPQDPNDEPASVLIEKIRAEKEALIKQGKIKRDKNESYIFKGDDNSYYEKVGNNTNQVSIPFDIPSTWSWCRLSTIAEIRNGFTPRRDNPSYWTNGNIPWFTIADKNEQGLFINRTAQHITSVATTVERIVPANSVLLCCTASVGEVAYTNIPLTTNQQFNGITIKENYHNIVNSFFLLFFSFTLKDFLKKELATATTFGFVSVKKVGSIMIPIPPLKEQLKIVDKLNAIFSEIEKINTACIDKGALCDKLIYKLLDHYFGDNSRYKSYYGKRTETTLEKLIPNEKIGDGDWVLSEDMNPNGDIQLLQLKHIGNMVYHNKSFCHIDENFFKEHNCSEIKENYLLINRLVASSMACCLMPQTNIKTITSVDVCWIAPDETYNSKYLMYYLSSKNFQNKILMLCSGSTRKRISKKNLTRIPLFIHDRVQQDIIVNRIENLFELVEKVIG